MKNPVSGPARDLDTRTKPLRTRPSAITLWRPEIVLPEPPVGYRSIVMPGEPRRRPDATRAQLDGTRTLLAALAEKRQSLSTRAAHAEARVREAATDQERVTAMLETYRVESALDDVLTGTMHELASLMKERGLR
jgi:hypothetical protein